MAEEKKSTNDIRAPYSEREKWFRDRVGKTVYRNRTTCKCRVCESSYIHGVQIADEFHAMYLWEWEGTSNYEDNDLRYFDTKEERDEFEKTLKSKIPT